MEKEVIICLREMLGTSRLRMMLSFTQHGDTKCLWHTIGVVYCALAIAKKFHIQIKKRELIRGGILHDYFLYDWHDGKKERSIHGFTHPGIALKNAESDFELTDTERDIIKKHMFPLTVIPPKTKEAWLICLADKICAFKETFGRNSYSAVRRMVSRQTQYITLIDTNAAERSM